MDDGRNAWEICNFVSGECLSCYSPDIASNYFGMRSNARPVVHCGIRTIVLGVTSGLGERTQRSASPREDGPHTEGNKNVVQRYGKLGGIRVSCAVGHWEELAKAVCLSVRRTESRRIAMSTLLDSDTLCIQITVWRALLITLVCDSATADSPY